MPSVTPVAGVKQIFTVLQTAGTVQKPVVADHLAQRTAAEQMEIGGSELDDLDLLLGLSKPEAISTNHAKV